MAQPNTKIPPKKAPRPARSPNGNIWFWVIPLVFFLIITSYNDKTNLKTEKVLTDTEFRAILKDNLQTHQIKHLEWTEGPDNTLKGTFSDGLAFKVNVLSHDDDLLKMIRDNVSDFSVVPPELFWSQLFVQMVPFLFIIAVIWFISYRGSQMGNKIFAFGK